MGVSEKGTKFVVNSKTDLIAQSDSTGTGFGVCGYKTLEGNLTHLFDNVEVHPEGNPNNPEWTYSPIRYWDNNPAAVYQFIAYWPHFGSTAGNGTYVSEQDKILTIHNIPNWQDGSLITSADIMTATQRGNYSNKLFTDKDGIQSEKVNFTFSHRLAKLIIRAYFVGDKNTHVFIQGLSFSGASFLSEGTVNYREGFGGQPSIDNPGMETPVLDNRNHTLFDGDVELGDDEFDDEQPNPIPEGEEDPTPYTPVTVCTWLVVPSAGWHNLGLNISYGIGAGNAAETTTVTVSIDPNQNQEYYLEEAHAYVINLRFDSTSGGVEVEKVYVKDWNDVDVAKPVYNW